jgi:protein phosphatase
MLSGELPYKEVSNRNLQSAKHNKWNYRTIKQSRDDIPQWVDYCLRKATHPLPERRYQVLSEFMVDLFTPNKSLLNEQSENSLLKRDPVVFWKSLALIVTAIAMLELLVILSP